MRLSRIFLILIIPLTVGALGAWLFSVTGGSRGVKVAGEFLGAPNLKIEILGAEKVVTPGGKRFRVELFVRNAGNTEAYVNPYRFQMVASRGLPATEASYVSSFVPLHAVSECPEAPDSFSRIPSGARRNMILIFWGETIPDNWDEEGYRFSLEYYDEEGTMIFSSVFNPA